MHTRRVLFLLLTAALFSTGCAVLGKEISFQPDAGATDWLKKDSKLIFHFDHSSIEAYPMWGSDHTVSLGPPFLPIIPAFLAKPHWDVQSLRLKLSTAELLKMDVSTFKLCFPSGMCISGEKYEELGDSGRVEPMKVPMVTLEKAEKQIYISFNAPFDQSESFEVEFGNVLKDTSQIPLPPLKYIRETKYKYFPFIFSH